MRGHKMPPNIALPAVLLEGMGGSGPLGPENHVTRCARIEARQITLRLVAPPKPEHGEPANVSELPPGSLSNGWALCPAWFPVSLSCPLVPYPMGGRACPERAMMIKTLPTER